MAVAYRSPGVYREEIFLQPETRLPTGIPGFVGLFATKGTASPPLVNSPLPLHRREEFADRFQALPESYLAEAIDGFFNNGGTRCYIVRADESQSNNREVALKSAIAALAPTSDLDLVAVPDAMSLLPLLPGDPRRTVDITLPQWEEQVQQAIPAVIRVQQALLAHCALLGDRFALLDALPGRTVATVTAQRHQLALGQTEPLNGAFYYPWLKTNSGRFVPPCGHIAGIYARSDRDRGVFKAPANEEIQGILDLEVLIGNAEQGQLNSEGINCLRTFPGRGLRVWGARTLSRDPNWRYINVRRLFLTLGRWIERNMQWATFEPHTPQLWNRIQRELGGYLTQLWQAGALQGETAQQAFFVKCDRETNPPEVREIGQVITEIGLAATAPTEWIIVRIIQHAGGTSNPQLTNPS